jgi:hypothetical protein
VKLNRIIVAAGLSLLVMADTLTARSDSPPPITSGSLGSFVVKVSDWPLGILPDDADAAFGPAALAACKQAVADWPVGVLPDDPFTGMPSTAVPPHSAGAMSSGVGGAGAFIPGPAPSMEQRTWAAVCAP